MIPSAYVVELGNVRSVWLGTHLSTLVPPMLTVPVGHVVNVTSHGSREGVSSKIMHS